MHSKSDSALSLRVYAGWAWSVGQLQPQLMLPSLRLPWRVWQPCSQKELRPPGRSQEDGSASTLTSWRSSSLLNQEAHKKALSLGNPGLPRFPPAWCLGKNNKGVSRTMAICGAEPALQSHGNPLPQAPGASPVFPGDHVFSTPLMLPGL